MIAHLLAQPPAREAPLTYPGRHPDRPCRLIDGTLHESSPDPTDKHAILAVGSNASPAQLAAKFGELDHYEVGLLPVQVSGLTVLPSAHLSRFGYWPYAPAQADEEPRNLVVCLLDEDELALLDITEPNYRRVPARAHVQQADGSPIDNCQVYESRHGIVDDPRIVHDGPLRQDELLQRLLALAPPGLQGCTSPADVVAKIRSDPSVADRLTDWLKANLTIRTSA